MTTASDVKDLESDIRIIQGSQNTRQLRIKRAQVSKRLTRDAAKKAALQTQIDDEKDLIVTGNTQIASLKTKLTAARKKHAAFILKSAKDLKAEAAATRTVAAVQKDIAKTQATIKAKKSEANSLRFSVRVSRGDVKVLRQDKLARLETSIANAEKKLAAFKLELPKAQRFAKVREELNPPLRTRRKAL